MMFRAALYLHCASMFIATLATEEIDLGDYYASDPVQILFGRHRDWENIRPIHFIIFGALFFALIAMYMYYLKWRYQELSESAREFPDIEFIRFAWFSIAPGIQRYCEMDKMKAEVEKKILLPEDAGVGTLEWSSKPILNPLLNSVKATEIINFRDFASKAHIMVEHLVIQRLPHMRCSNFRTIEVGANIVSTCFLASISILLIILVLMVELEFHQGSEGRVSSRR
eukprot:jgi/Bigna1/91350/estExt_fgenesh1_pg.C_980008